MKIKEYFEKKNLASIELYFVVYRRAFAFVFDISLFLLSKYLHSRKDSHSVAHLNIVAKRSHLLARETHSSLSKFLRRP
ncbi:MAG: hypothetical protein UW28_C0036G0008 [Parcubacteria group bacterium GW2011_GWA2_44_13]|nr:MAG: hypothetical protein UW28_C0036G0008 [Parcubacteria group bacterium GW2011_GWA2_44_13]